MYEFGLEFFQGYADLKKRVALVHAEWDLSTFSRVNLYYWDMEASAEEGDLVAKVDTSVAEGAGEIQEEVVVVDDELAA